MFFVAAPYVCVRNGAARIAWHEKQLALKPGCCLVPALYLPCTCLVLALYLPCTRAMPHLGGKTCKLSIDLGNVRRALKSGKTRGKQPRDLTEGEINELRTKEKALLQKQREVNQTRFSAKIISHTTAEANRVIQTVEDSTRDSSTFFKSIGGSG